VRRRQQRRWRRARRQPLSCANCGGTTASPAAPPTWLPAPPHQTPRPSPAVKRKHEIRKLGSAEVVTHHRNARELRAFGGCGEVGEKPLHDSHACLGQLVGDSEGGSDLKGGGRALARRLRCARRRVLRHRAILCRAHGAPAPSTHPFREISRGSRREQSGLRWVCVDEVPAEEGFGQVRGSG
jgi:hypothetical protein